ncbi:hypothetical protein ACO0QE_003808 [Hanseniaspora vineae]
MDSFSGKGNVSTNASNNIKNKYLLFIKKLHKSDLVFQNLNYSNGGNSGKEDRIVSKDDGDTTSVDSREPLNSTFTNNKNTELALKNDTIELQNLCQNAIKTEIMKFYLTYYETYYADFHKILMDYIVKMNKLDRIYFLIYYGQLILQLNMKSMIDLQGKGNVAYEVLHNYLLKDLPLLYGLVLFTNFTSPRANDFIGENKSIAYSDSTINWACSVTNMPVALQIFSNICKIFNQKNGKDDTCRRIVLEFDDERLTTFNSEEEKIVIAKKQFSEFFNIKLEQSENNSQNQKYYESIFPKFSANENDVMLESDQQALIETWKILEQTYHLKRFSIYYFASWGFPGNKKTESEESGTAITTNEMKTIHSDDVINSTVTMFQGSAFNNSNNNKNGVQTDESLLHRIEFDRERHKKSKEQNWTVERRAAVLEYEEFQNSWNAIDNESDAAINDLDSNKKSNTYSLSLDDQQCIQALQTIYLQSV